MKRPAWLKRAEGQYGQVAQARWGCSRYGSVRTDRHESGAAWSGVGDLPWLQTEGGATVSSWQKQKRGVGDVAEDLSVRGQGGG